MAREHNDANVVAVGGRQHTVEEATELIEAFLAEPFSNDERHVRRIGKIAAYESTGEVIE
ncbi:ribose-5-phosphate isomerase B [Arthrobacter sp. Hiyo4]|nr:ribose-5-phosphate isomerase B [Arthrobacter sp. Hiyo4]